MLDSFISSPLLMNPGIMMTGNNLVVKLPLPIESGSPFFFDRDKESEGMVDFCCIETRDSKEFDQYTSYEGMIRCRI